MFIEEYIEGLERKIKEYDKELPNEFGSYWNPYKDELMTFKNLSPEGQLNSAKREKLNDIKCALTKPIHHPIFRCWMCRYNPVWCDLEFPVFDIKSLFL